MRRRVRANIISKPKRYKCFPHRETGRSPRGAFHLYVRFMVGLLASSMPGISMSLLRHPCTWQIRINKGLTRVTNTSVWLYPCILPGKSVKRGTGLLEWNINITLRRVNRKESLQPLFDTIATTLRHYRLRGVQNPDSCPCSYNPFNINSLQHLTKLLTMPVSLLFMRIYE
jgi:hypothetical protein